MGIYDFIDEVSLAKLGLRIGELTVPVLPPVSDSGSTLFGECRQMAVTDVCTVNRRIHEASKTDESDYFDNVFGDSYSPQNLIDREKLEVGKEKWLSTAGLLDRVRVFGVGSSKDYESLPSDSGLGVRKQTGNKRLSISGTRKFVGDNLHVSVKEMKAKNRKGSLPHFLKTTGAAVGVCKVYGDYLTMSDVTFYEPKEKRSEDDLHAVMIVGCGIARNKISKELKPYYLFQNNWGERSPKIGRMGIEHFIYADAPVFDAVKEPDVVKEPIGSTKQFVTYLDRRL